MAANDASLTAAPGGSEVKPFAFLDAQLLLPKPDPLEAPFVTKQVALRVKDELTVLRLKRDAKQGKKISKLRNDQESASQTSEIVQGSVEPENDLPAPGAYDPEDFQDETIEPPDASELDEDASAPPASAGDYDVDDFDSYIDADLHTETVSVSINVSTPVIQRPTDGSDAGGIDDFDPNDFDDDGNDFKTQDIKQVLAVVTDASIDVSTIDNDLQRLFKEIKGK